MNYIFKTLKNKVARIWRDDGEKWLAKLKYRVLWELKDIFQPVVIEFYLLLDTGYH